AGEKVKSRMVTSADPAGSGMEPPGPVTFDPLLLLQLNAPASTATPINRANVISTPIANVVNQASATPSPPLRVTSQTVGRLGPSVAGGIRLDYCCSFGCTWAKTDPQAVKKSSRRGVSVRMRGRQTRHSAGSAPRPLLRHLAPMVGSLLVSILTSASSSTSTTPIP